MRSFLLSMIFVIGCSSDGDPPPAAGCIQGETRVCACSDGRSGAQTCNAAGTFDACVCTTIDSGVDTAAPVDTAPVLCDQPLPTDFKCVAPKKATPGKACSESQLQEMVNACIASPLSKTPATCAPWKAANVDCAACVVGFSVTYYPSRAVPSRNQCYWATFDDECDTALQCSFDCQAQSCDACDTSTGTSADGKTSAYSECQDRVRASKPVGACWELISKKANTCLAATPYDFCILSELNKETPDIPTLKPQVIEFYRGACRDGGDWTNRLSATPKGADAGTDVGGTDAGSD